MQSAQYYAKNPKITLFKRAESQLCRQGTTLTLQSGLLELESTIQQGETGKALMMIKRLLEHDDALVLQSGPTAVSRLMRDNNNACLGQDEDSRPNTQGEQPSLGQTGKYHLKIYTLGRFSVVKDGRPIYFKSKAQHKPLELLKILIALGGRDISKSHIAELLWQDAEGDLAVQAFDTTLCRLRKLVGKEAILILNGRITLNPDYCWIDCWAFERLLNSIHEFNTADVEMENMISKVLSYYQGGFLERDDAGWLISRREKLRSKFLRTINRFSRYLLGINKYEAVIDLVNRALEIDGLIEDFYITQMRCQIQLGKYSEAVMTYQRCHKTLKEVIGIEPSIECYSLYQSLMKNDP